MLYNWGKKILEKVDEVLDQLHEKLVNRKNKLQPQPVIIKPRR